MKASNTGNSYALTLDEQAEQIKRVKKAKHGATVFKVADSLPKRCHTLVRQILNQAGIQYTVTKNDSTKSGFTHYVKK